METNNNEQIHYPAVNRCIYCGNIDEKLSDEHIIPYGLGGTWILPKSSCPKCQKIINEFETFNLHSMLGGMRIKLNFPTRNHDKRPESLPIRYLDNDEKHITQDAAYIDFIHKEFFDENSDHSVKKQSKSNILSVSAFFVQNHNLSYINGGEIPSDEIPLICLGLKLSEPGFLREVSPTDDIDFKIVFGCEVSQEQIDQYVLDKKMCVGTIDPYYFCRMIAKISHSYAIAKYGYGTFEPLLTDLILGKSNTPSYYIGGDTREYKLDAQPVLHYMSLFEHLHSNQNYILASIQLLHYLKMPKYLAVVGKLK